LAAPFRFRAPVGIEEIKQRVKITTNRRYHNMKTMKSSLKIYLYIFSICIFIAGQVNSVQAITITDNFNDGNADGWISVAGYPPGTFGNWRVSNGAVIQDQGHDGFMFLLNNFPMSSQSVEAKIQQIADGGNGLTIWYQDENNYVWGWYPGSNGNFVVTEKVNGTFVDTLYPLQYNEKTFKTVRLDANSLTGEIAIYFDGDYLATYMATTTNRTGLSGFVSGNGGGSFDDFSVTTVPLPSAVLLLGSGLLRLANYRRRKKS
jgi:hypothetical protein